MWNSQRTDAPAGLRAGVTAYHAGDGDLIHAYVARPEGPGPFPGVVLAHHMPGWDELYREFARLFGDQDQYPTPELVDRHEEELRKHGKEYEFHRYAGAGHGFFYYHRAAYRPESAMDGWAKVFDFFGRHLTSGS